MTEDRARIGAYVDGEMDEIARRRFQAEMAGDPALARAVAAEERLRTALRARFDPLLDEPVPPALTSLIAEQAKVVPLAARPRRWSAAAVAAMAASLALGLVLGTQLRPQPELRSEGGVLVAAGTLGDALETRLASAGGEGVRIGFTFRNAEGAWCRTFEQGPRAGIACRTGGDWQVRRLDVAKAGGGTEYRQAGSDAIAAAAQDMAADAPLDAEAERRVVSSGWR
jgi:hypothetical protein